MNFRFRSGETFILSPTCIGYFRKYTPAQVGRDVSFRNNNGSVTFNFVAEFLFPPCIGLVWK